MTELKLSRATEIVSRFRGRRLLVLGDLMLDRYVWGKASRISPEAPVPVVEIERESEELGGAGNVVANLIRLGATARPVGLVGDDSAAERLLSRCQQLGADHSLILRDASRPTTTKTRIIAHHQQLVRADHESRQLADAATTRSLLDRACRALEEVEGVVISDYDKGALTPEFLNRFLPRARASSIPTFLDPKVRHFRHYQPVTLLKPNHREAERVTQIEITDQSSLDRAARSLLGIIDCEHLLITRGEEGMSLYSRDAAPVHIPAGTREVFDVTGAGDTVMATVSLAYCSGASAPEAAMVANQAASVVITKLGAATLTPDELLATFQKS